MPILKKSMLCAAVSAALTAYQPPLMSQVRVTIPIVSPTRGLTLVGSNSLEKLGSAVARAGDINGDGIEDLLVGAPGVGVGGTVYVLFGNRNLVGTISSAALDGTLGFAISGVAGREIGSAVASAGDFNGDGRADILLGHEGEPSGAYLILGSDSSFPALFPVTSLDGSNGFHMPGPSEEGAGREIAGAGDFNGDGFDDLLIGAPFADRLRREGFEILRYDRAGKAYLVFGDNQDRGPELALASIGGATGRKFLGESENDFSGRRISAARDFNGDGFDDFVLGARNDKAHLVFGYSGGNTITVRLDGLDGVDGFQINGAAPNDGVGADIAGAGDVNGDGLDDLIVGSPYARTNNKYTGTAHVIYGSAQNPGPFITTAGVNGFNGFQLVTDESNGYLGATVSSAGDVNGDGFNDVLVSRPQAYINNLNNAGVAYVVFGDSGSTTPAIDLDRLWGEAGVPVPGYFENGGNSMAMSDAGDFNGDGLEDFVVSFPTGSLSEVAAGEAYIIFGNSAPSLSTLSLNAMGVEDQLSSAQFQTGGIADTATVANDVRGFAAVANEATTEQGTWQFRPPGDGWISISRSPSDNDAWAIASLGDFRFSPVPNFNGPAPALGIRLWDRDLGVPASNLDLTPYIAGFGGFSAEILWLNVAVQPVNDAPDFQAMSPSPVADSAGHQSIANWATFDPGPSDEAAQQSSYQVTRVSRAELFQQLPEVSPSGTLSFVPALGHSGQADFDVLVTDTGGTANGGIDTSAVRTYTITITSDNIFTDGFE